MRFDLKDLRTKQRIALQFYGVFFALSVGAVLYQIISANFITSDAWATVATIPVYTFSLGAIVAFVVFVLPVWTKQASKLGIGDRIVPIFMIPFTALLAIELGNLAFPTMHAQFFETQREMVFVVREFDKFGARGCSNQRELEGGLSLSDR
ncbi:hypothetical protein SAMN05444003_3192 [Cognatiyoonia sediminum]|uniref:Uncharacterized protein n=1 Tax=Cognatiyoonia sediminum TaxID=1508389 RepID=A0A1M5SYG3_9RHOB|nr:hypothetical protein [Cognatiyoonia sediminum]SHH43519.1 hypothetical protein SAMN05444003_3192 [Cognatiyoonia sediminum]